MALGHVIYGAEPYPLPITHLFNDLGEEVDEWDHAATFVAGPLANGTWLSGLTAAFERWRPN